MFFPTNTRTTIGVLSMLALLGAPLCSVASAAPPPGRSVLAGSHANRAALPFSCRTCHRGMAMTIASEEQVCLNCHGDTQSRERMVATGYLRLDGGVSLADIGVELRKPYAHPTLTTGGVHRQNEVLPEEVMNAARHAECFDCHKPHVVEKGRPFRGISGKRVGNFIADIDKEYQLCYKCHSTSANLPSGSTDKAMEFRTTNPSFHPVEAEGRNAYIVSLLKPYVARAEKPGDVSMITCSDCHGSDDPSGPKGPHGSNYRGLLVANYEMEDGRPESEFVYGLCYKCHNRASILGNESFPWHALHIEGNRATGTPGTSCFTCHDAHGSSVYPNLIRFNEDIVRPAVDGKLEFKAQGVATRHGSCTLNCHGVEHSQKNY